MSSWAQSRRLTYITVIIFAFVGVSAYILFSYFYTPPTCFDGIKNGREQGIDCGGTCVKLCQDNFAPPSVAWTSFERVGEGLYNLSAYIINPNTDVSVVKIPYRFVVFDAEGHQIIENMDFVTIPAHRNTLAFLPSVSTGKRIPFKVLFEFLQKPEWVKRPDTLSALEIRDKKYSENQTGSSLFVTIYNASVYSSGKITVYVVLTDARGTTIGFSKTIIDNIPPQSQIDAPFTWPNGRDGKVVSIEVLPVKE